MDFYTLFSKAVRHKSTNRTVEIFRYLVSGIVAFGVDTTILYALTEYDGLYYLLSSIISFCGQSLNKPGTLIQLDNGDIHLIGSIVSSGNIFTDNSESLDCYLDKIPADAIVVKYCQIINLNEAQNGS